MLLTEQIEKDYILAYKNRENEKVAVLRMVKAAIKNRQVELGKGLTDAQALEVLVREVKQRQESIRQFTHAGRHDLSRKEQDELEIVQSYLPSPLTSDEMKRIAAETIAELQVSRIKDMGLVMKTISRRYPGQMDGRELSAVVRDLLSS